MINLKNSNFIANTALIVAMIIWASSFVALKYTFATFDPMVVVFGRMFVASVCFLFFWKYFKNLKFNKSDIKYILMMAFFEPCLYFLFEAEAIMNTTASGAGMITALLPLLVAIGARWFLNENITKNMLIGFSLAIVGSIWLSLSANSSNYAPNPIYGNFMEFLAMICATGYVLTLKHLSSKFGPFFLTSVQAFVGAIFYFPILFLPSVEKPVSFELFPTLAVIYLGLVVTLGAYGLYNFGVSRTTASTASAYVNLIPAFTLILAYILLGESLSTNEMIASGIIFVGVLISQIKSKKKLNYT